MARDPGTNPICDPLNLAVLSIFVGLGDVAGMRQMLSKAFADSEPAFSIQITGGVFLEAFRSDREIDRLLFELYGR